MKNSLLLFAGLFAFGLLVIIGYQTLPAATQTGGVRAAPAAAPQATVTVEPLPPGAIDTPILSNMEYPIAMAFDSTGRLFYTEKRTNASTGQGRVRLVVGGVLQATPVITFSVDSSSERGLLGITLDPDFNTNRYIYVFYTAPGSSTTNNVARFQEVNGNGINPTIIFSSTQTAGNHNGGNIHFGPDGKLYISVGENANPANSQNVTVKNGKMHRINSDGTFPADNPVFTQTGALPSLYAMGLRNSFDFAFDPLDVTAPYRMFASENGPSCDDEMNRIEAGYNYGWRSGYPCDDANPSPTYNTIPPLWYLPNGPCCYAPTGLEVYSGASVPQWQNDVFMCTYSNGQLRRFYMDPTRTQVITEAVVSGVTCNMDIQTGPDGAFYYIQGGGYSAGTLHRISGSGGGTATPTPTAPTATRTATAGPPTLTRTATPLATSTQTSIPGTATPTNTPGGPSPTNTPMLPPPPTGTATPTPSVTTTPCPIQFQDVPSGSTFYDYVRCLACRGIVAGYPCGGPGEPCPGSYFRPSNNVTRGQIAKIVVSSAGITNPVPSDQQTFQDVAPGSTFWLWVEQLAGRGIIGGYPCGGPNEPCVAPGNRPYYRPNADVTRGQLAKIDASTAGYTETPTGQTFEDVAPGSTFYLYVERIASRGIIGGYPCGSVGEPCVAPGNRPYYRPFNNVTRGQSAKIVANTFFPGCSTPARR